MNRRVGAAAGVVTLALHVLVALLLMWQTAARKAAPPVKRVSVRLLALPAPPVKSSPSRPITPESSSPRFSARTNTRPAPQRQDTAVAPSLAAPAAPGESPTSTPASNASASPPLVLTLPASAMASMPRSMVNAALNDPRSNTRLTPSERFAADLGTNTDRVEERIVDGIRVRQGNSCVLVHESKGAAIDPFSQSTRPLPKMVEKCP